MAIPEQVKQQSEVVKSLYKELNLAPGEEESQAPEIKAEEVSDTDRVDAQAPTTAPEEQTAAVTQEDESLTQKYKTLQGMYNAEVPRLNADKRELAARVSQLEQLLSSASLPKPTPEIPAVPESTLSAQDMEDYGDSIDVMRRVNQEGNAVANQKITQLENTINQLSANMVPRVEQLSQAQATNTENVFWSELEANVPNWQETNNQPEFQTWLLAIDPLTGISRQTYLEDAQSNFDVRRVASFFATWQGMNGVPQARVENQQASAASELEKQVAPGKGKSTGVPSNTDTERARIERDIFAAQREGRIV